MKTYEITITGSGTQLEIVKALHRMIGTFSEKLGDRVSAEDHVLYGEIIESECEDHLQSCDNDGFCNECGGQ